MKKLNGKQWLSAWNKPRPPEMELWLRYTIVMSILCGMNALMALLSGGALIIVIADLLPAVTYWYAMLVTWQEGKTETWMFLRMAALLSLIATAILIGNAVKLASQLDPEQLAAFVEGSTNMGETAAKAAILTVAGTSMFGHASVQGVLAAVDYLARRSRKR